MSYQNEVDYWIWAAKLHIRSGYKIARVPEFFIDAVKNSFDGPIETIEAARERWRLKEQAH